MSMELFERSKKVVPGGVHSPVRSFKGLDRPPVFFKSAQGAHLTDVNGKEYIDFCQSFGPLILGHRDPDVQAQVMEMINTAWSFGAAEPYSLELAEWMTQELSFLGKLRFVSSGTEAVMSALRVARAFTKRNKVLKFEGCYHGHVDSLLVEAGSGLAGVSAASSAGIPEALANTTLVAPLDNEKFVEEIFKTHGSDIAVVVVEPLPANYGLLTQRLEWLRFLRKISTKYGALLLFDEVISGFRVGLTGMSGFTGIDPDLVCYGKIIGGGFPVGCYGGKSEIMDLVAPLGPVYQAGTLSANPVGMRAGLVTLKKMKDLDGWHVLSLRTQKFCKEMQNIFDKNDSDLQVVSQCSLFWIHQKRDKPIRTVSALPKNQAQLFKPFFLKLLDAGVYLAPNAYEVGFLSLAHTDSVLEKTLSIMDKALKK